MSEKILHLGEVIHWIQAHIALMAFFFGAAIGAIAWAWNEYTKRFATVKVVNELRSENMSQHAAIVEKLNENHAEVLRTIIRKHND